MDGNYHQFALITDNTGNVIDAGEYITADGSPVVVVHHGFGPPAKAYDESRIIIWPSHALILN